MEYLDFEVRVAPGSGHEYPVSVVRSPAGESTSTMRFPFDALALQNHLRGLEIAVLKSASLRRDISMAAPEKLETEDFGQQLFHALFTPEVQVAFRRSQDRARAENKGLRIRLRVEAPELSSLPWEFMYDPSDRDFLCLSTDTPVVRYLEFDQPPAALTIHPPLSILVMIASPSDRPTLDVARERERIEKATSALREAGLVDLKVLEGSTWRDLQHALRRGKYHIFHFVGHGGFDDAAGEGVLAFTNDDGRSALMSATEVGRFISDHPTMRLVVLNSCLGARGNATDVFSSTSATLVGRGLPAVVAMQFEISDNAAIEFSRSLYEAIADGMPIDAAVTEARKAVSASARNSVEWGTPVLHMRSPDGILFRIDGMTPSQARATGQYPTPSAPRRVPVMEPAAAADTPASAPVPEPIAAPDIPAPAATPVSPPAQRLVTPAGPAAGGAGSRQRMMWAGGVAAVAVVGAAAWWILNRGGGDVVSEVSLTRVPSVVIRGGEAPATFRIFYRSRVVTGSEAADVLQRTGARVELRSRDTLTIAPGAQGQPGTLMLRGLKVGTTDVWPVIVQANGVIIDSAVHSPVEVQEEANAILAAIDSLDSARKAAGDDEIPDSALLARVQHFDASVGTILRGPARKGEELDGLLKGLQGLVAARARADSTIADTNKTLPDKHAALQAYLDLATSVRDGHGPSLVTDAARLKELDASTVGTVLKAYVCRAPCESERLDGEFARGTSVGIKVWYVRGNSGRLSIEWRHNGATQPTPRSYTAENNRAGYRISDEKNVGDAAGTWEVRVRNGARHVVFRHEFRVQ